MPYVQSNLYITATFGTTKTWPLYTGCRYTETLNKVVVMCRFFKKVTLSNLTRKLLWAKLTFYKVCRSCKLLNEVSRSGKALHEVRKICEQLYKVCRICQQLYQVRRMCQQLYEVHGTRKQLLSNS